jgi:hypothetical protein
MKRPLFTLQLTLLSIAVILAVSFLAPLPIPYYQDFSVLYFSNKGLLQGIHLYDYPAQLEMVLAQTQPDFTFHPYPYPPWYALSTLYLATLPIYVAARMWFLLNLVMVATATWLLTPQWKAPFRLFAILGAVLFIPAFGLLIVGQYSVPVLLGVALFIYSARKEASAGIAASLGLMTFKPHIGLFLALAAFGWLLYRREAPFARRAIIMTVILAVVLAALGFLADPAWPLAYLESLGRYRDIPGVQSCGLCASLSVGLVRVATGRSDTLQAAWVSLILAAGLAGLFLWRFRPLLRHPSHLMALSAAFTLLIDPYLLNYDYVLLLVPLLLLAQARRWLVIIPYLIPWIALAFGREGNLLLSLATLIVLLIYWKNRDEIALSGLPIVS